MIDYNNFLSKEVAEEFEVINWTGGHKQYFGSKYRTVNLKKLTLTQARSLVNRGFTKLVKKELKAPVKAGGSTKEKVAK